MRRRLFPLLLLWLPISAASIAADTDAGPPDPVGIWRGELEQGDDPNAGPLLLVLRIRHGEEGFTATLEGPGANLRNLKVENLILVEDVLSFQLSQLQVRFAGNFSPVGDSLRGTWSQGEDSRPLIFFRD